MIYLQEGNFPLNEAFSSEIVQEANSTYQLTFKFPTSDPKWASLTPETELVADDLHGEQYFTIFEVEKQHGYVTVYANQVATLLNGYSINKINVDRVNGATVMNALVAGFKRETPFTFFSDVMSKHTLNLKDISAMEALAKDKHSIVGQWGGDLVRDKYSVRLLENGGIENESLFSYKKNMKSFQETKSTKELRTRIHFKKVIEAHEEGKKDQILTVTIDSPLINKYKHIYEADMEVQDQDVVDQKTLEEYGKRYFRETLCDMIEESLEIDVVGQADQPVHMFDIVSIFHEGYDVDLRKKITKYKFNPMSIKLVSIGFGEVTRTLADSISGMVNDSVDKKMKSYDAEYEAKVQKLVDNANAEYDKQAKELEHKITDGIEQAKAQAEVVKQEISAQVTDKINAANQANKNEIVEEFKAQYNGIEVNMQGLKATTDQLKTSDADIQKLINDFKDQTQSQFAGIQGAQSRFEQTIQGLSTQLTKLETKTGPSGELEQRMLTYSEKAAVDAVKATRQILEQGYVAKSQYTEDVAGITRRFDEIVQAGENLLKNSGNPQNVEGWGYYDPGLSPVVTVSTNPIYYNESRKLFKLDNSTNSEKVAASQRFNTKRNTTYTISFDAIGSDNLKNATFYFLARKKDETGNFTKVFTLADKIAIPRDRITRYYFTVNSKDYDEAFLRFDNTGSSNGQPASLFFGDIDVYEGSLKRAYQPPTDNGSSVIEAKLAEYKQTVDGQFTTITNQMGDMLRKTDIQITPGQISFGVGKEISGRTISSLLVQEPESIALIAKLIKVKGDMVVDGSILGRHIASKSVETGHMKAGSVTTPILASNAVTADKVQVDYALIQKLLANQAFIRELTSQKAFITQLASIDFSAERIQGGRLLSTNGATDFNLENGTINFYSNKGSIKRIDDTTSSQFIRLEQGDYRGERVIDKKAARIVIGTNHDKKESVENATFSGTRLWSGSGNGEKESFYEVVADRIAFYANGQYRSPWLLHNNTRDRNTYLIPLNENNVKHIIGRGDKHFHAAYIDNVYVGKEARNVAGYLWDILTCFGILARYGWDTKNPSFQNHTRDNLINKYGFR